MSIEVTAGQVRTGDRITVKAHAEQVSMTLGVFQPPVEHVDTQMVRLGHLAVEVTDDTGEAVLASSAGPS